MPSDTTVGDLIDRLSAYPREAAVRLAVNPFFPMAHQLARVVAASDEHGDLVVLLADGEQLGHLPPTVAVALTWHASASAPSTRRRGTTRPGSTDNR